MQWFVERIALERIVKSTREYAVIFDYIAINSKRHITIRYVCTIIINRIVVR